ncbi:MAG: hypothetical protein CL608_17675 [Anaerolineaceae bacterium]|nr:hypothetical protein [Anaerolineaceae bacterium]
MNPFPTNPKLPQGKARWRGLVWLLLLVFLLAVPASVLAVRDPGAFMVTAVSSAPDQVTGGDARLHIELPDSFPLHRISVTVNRVEMRDHFNLIPGTNTLSGVIDGLQLGDNQVRVRALGFGRQRPYPADLTLTNYPITGPVFSGPHQHPFVCTVQDHGLGQPLVDNDNTGIPVYATDAAGNLTDEIVGYSKNCSAERLVVYVYRSTSGSWLPYELGQERPSDMAQTTTMDGKTVDYIVRWERGTINRFIYSLAMLAPDDTSPDDHDTSAWNGKLIYHFQGGVGIGHTQGSPSGSRMLYEYGLSQGYGIAYSTGTKAGEHYNLVVGGETALMVKERFIELYDTPIYTVGVGASGGAIQQYVYGQNHKGLIDAAIPVYSYPDMITQAIHVGDCELLEFFMDVTDGANPRWQTWSNRTLIQGMNASDVVPNPYTQALGNTECINGWRGLSPLALNPHYGAADNMEQYVPLSDIAAIEWTHFGDLVNIYGVGDDGFARSPWDNVGVQYGLEAVANGSITPEEFLKLNANIGGWKNEPEMVQEGSPFFPPGEIDFTNWDPWSVRNQVLSPDGGLTPAQRTEGDMLAAQAAYEAGLVFMGDMQIPIIDWRHYLEPVLDMHNSHQSFAARLRLLDYDGDASNQVIWFTGITEDGDAIFDQTPEAFQVIDEWMSNIQANPELGVAGNKPSRATDRCFDAFGNEIASGDDVWDGIINDAPMGACAELYPPYATSRIVAGGPFKGSIFKCALQPVSQAIANGDYGVWQPTADEQARLEQIFPDGVCDFNMPDRGLPPGW